MKNSNKPKDAVHKAFEKGHAAFMPYYTLGYPDFDISLDIIEACVDNGSDLMELGIPFSDPLADGPTIQHSSQVALQNGAAVARCLRGVEELRSRGIDIPFMLMGYYNPVLRYVPEKFVEDACEAGANGFIIPDLPPDEAGLMISLCAQHGMALAFLISPNSPVDRIETLSQLSTGFVYLVSITGITGARDTLPNYLDDFVSRVRERSKLPVAVGFGISTPEQARMVGKVADGVIVGSALIKATDEGDDPIRAAGGFVKAMVETLQ